MKESPKNQLDERTVSINEGMKFLYENEAVREKPLINHLYANIYHVSWISREAEYILYDEKKVISVYLKLNWLGTFRFIRRGLALKVINGIQELLPNYDVKVTVNKKKWDEEVKEGEKKAKESPLPATFNGKPITIVEKE